MKKHLALAFALVILTNARAQDNESKFKLGFLANSSFGWVSGESKNISGGGLKPGLGFGIYGDYFFADNYAFSVEIQHSTQGFKALADSICIYNSGSGTFSKFGDVTIDYRIRSFQFPITLKLRTNEIGYWRYYGQVGIMPSFAYKGIRANFSPGVFPKEDDNSDRLINDQENDFITKDRSQVNAENEENFLAEDNISGFRMPILVGMGTEWSITPSTAILFSLRYEYGLLNMMKAEQARATRNSLGLVVGVRF